MNGIYTGILWLLYFGLHSAFAMERVKSFFARRFPYMAKWYRQIYIIFAVVNFLLLARLHIVVPSPDMFTSTFWTKLCAGILGIQAIISMYLSIRQSGWSRLFLSAAPNPADTPLLKNGIYATIRHPMYLAILLGVVGLFLYFPSGKNAMFMLTTSFYLVIGSMLEEQKLIGIYEAEYLAYRQNTRMFIPFLW